MNRRILLLLLSTFPFFLSAQYLTGIGTKWSDEFTEWTIYTEDEDIEGDLVMRWQMQGDWSVWDYRIEEESGSIRLKWKDNPYEWEILGHDDRIMARVVWPNDTRSWRVTNNDITLTLERKYGNTFDEWQVRESEYGNFEIYTAWEGDPREWIITDELDESVSLPMKVALTFLSVFHSSPRY